eukprot:jgi/Chrpa1/7233/Chrysochromulina_OHIO_Genome00014016-RA
MLRLGYLSATMATCAALCASPFTATMARSSHLPVAMCDAAAATATKDMSMSMPPDSFKTLIADAADATDAAIAEGTKLIEIEFPPLPISKLDDSSVSSYDVLAANLQFVIEFTKKLKKDATTGLPRKVALTLPDADEQRRARKFYGDVSPWPGLTLHSLNGGDLEAEGFNPMSAFGALFKQGTGEVTPAEWASMYIVVGASCQELPTIAALHKLEPNKPIVCFNLKLDTLRGDLGLPAFPSRNVHHEFLCRIKPAYYMRPRSYSLSLSVPPFLIAYSGVLFRRYPEPYQTLLDRGRGSYRRVNAQPERPNLGTFKSQLTSALKLADDKAAASAISQAGYKQSTWWEDDADGKDVSKEWRL